MIRGGGSKGINLAAVCPIERKFVDDVRRNWKKVVKFTEKRKENENMTKLISGSKKAVAVFLLAIMVVCAAAPSVQAANRITKNGWRGKDGTLNCSYTTVYGYDGRGVQLIMSAAAQYSGMWGYDYGKLNPKAKSPSAGGIYDAYHAYGVGNNIEFSTKWKQN